MKEKIWFDASNYLQDREDAGIGVLPCAPQSPHHGRTNLIGAKSFRKKFLKAFKRKRRLGKRNHVIIAEPDAE